MHPFCFHCIEEVQAMVRGWERAPEIESTSNSEWSEDNSQTENVCTKIPLRTEAEFDSNLFFKLNIHETLAILTQEPIHWERNVAQHPTDCFQSLYLSLGILLI